ncbi:MAG TPA: hypothetical protein VGJ26_01415, partial [Pirellulales bacterium]
MTRSRKIAAPLTILVVGAIALFGARAWNEKSASSGAAPPERQPPPAADPSDVTPRLISRIEPGLKIGDAAPEGWSHLVLHAVPRLAEGNVEKVSPLVNRLVSRF